MKHIIFKVSLKQYYCYSSKH
uniref:Uncharacterized protein n=1 Tax=Lepeophtheirus salmonis TaxID=72036 RepID=A0A0K2T604_LEPSM